MREGKLVVLSRTIFWATIQGHMKIYISVVWMILELIVTHKVAFDVLILPNYGRVTLHNLDYVNVQHSPFCRYATDFQRYVSSRDDFVGPVKLIGHKRGYVIGPVFFDQLTQQRESFIDHSHLKVTVFFNHK